MAAWFADVCPTGESEGEWPAVGEKVAAGPTPTRATAQGHFGERAERAEKAARELTADLEQLKHEVGTDWSKEVHCDLRLGRLQTALGALTGKLAEVSPPSAATPAPAPAPTAAAKTMGSWKPATPKSKSGKLALQLLETRDFTATFLCRCGLPDETRVLSIALFDHVEALDYERAHIIASGLLVFSFALLFLLYSLDRKWQKSPLAAQS